MRGISDAGKALVPRRHVKRVSTTCQLRKMAFLLPVILSLPKLKSNCLLDGFALPGLLIPFHLTLISDTPCYVFCTVGRLHFFHGRESHFFLHRHRLNRTTRLLRGFLYTKNSARKPGAVSICQNQAFLAISVSWVKAAASLTASSASILRLISMPATFRPCMKVE